MIKSQSKTEPQSHTQTQITEATREIFTEMFDQFIDLCTSVTHVTEGIIKIEKNRKRLKEPNQESLGLQCFENIIKIFEINCDKFKKFLKAFSVEIRTSIFKAFFVQFYSMKSKAKKT